MDFEDSIGANPTAVVEDLLRQQQPDLGNGAVDPTFVLNRLIRKSGATAQAKRQQAATPPAVEPQDFSSFGAPADAVAKPPEVAPSQPGAESGSGNDFSSFGAPAEAASTPSDTPSFWDRINQGIAETGGMGETSSGVPATFEHKGPPPKPADDYWPGHLPTAGSEFAQHAITGTGSALKGAVAAYEAYEANQASNREASKTPEEKAKGQVEVRAPVDPRNSALYQTGENVEKYGRAYFPTSKTQDESVTGMVSGGLGGLLGMTPGIAVGTMAGGPLGGIAAGAAQMAASSAGDTFTDAINKGATPEEAAKAAGLSALSGGALGALPLGVILRPVKQLAPGLLAFAATKLEHALQSGVVFGAVGEAQHYLAKEIEKNYNQGYVEKLQGDQIKLGAEIAKVNADPRLASINQKWLQQAGEQAKAIDAALKDAAGYEFEIKRLVASLLTGAIAGSVVPPYRPASPEQAFINKVDAARGGGTVDPGPTTTDRGPQWRKIMDDWIAARDRGENPPEPTEAQWRGEEPYSTGPARTAPMAPGLPRPEGEAPAAAGAAEQRPEPRTASPETATTEAPKPPEGVARRDRENDSLVAAGHDPREITDWSPEQRKEALEAAAEKAPTGTRREREDDMLARYGLDPEAVPSDRRDAYLAQAAKTFGEEAPQARGTRDDPVELRTGADLDRVDSLVNEDYTHAQGEANNVRRVHGTLWGIPLTFEAKAGGVRRGTVPKTGEPWETTMGATYGYAKGTEGADGDHVDFFVGPHPETDRAFIIDELGRDGKFQQHKVMAGFLTTDDAIAAFDSTSSKRHEDISGITTISADDLKGWLQDRKATKSPLAGTERTEPQAAEKAAEPAATPRQPTGPASEEPAASAPSGPRETQPVESKAVPAERRGPEDLTEAEFRAAVHRGVIGPAEPGLRPGFARVEREPIEARGPHGSLIRHRDTGMNLGYSVDDIARHAAHSWAMDHDEKFDRIASGHSRRHEPQETVPSDEQITSSYNELRSEVEKYGPPKLASEATLKDIEALKSDEVPPAEFVDEVPAEAGPPHHDAIEGALREAGVDPDLIRPVDIARAAEVHAEEGYDPSDAFQLATVRGLVEDGLLTPQKVEEIYGPEIKSAMDAGLAPERGLRPEAPESTVGGQAATPQDRAGSAEQPPRRGETGQGEGTEAGQGRRDDQRPAVAGEPHHDEAGGSRGVGGTTRRGEPASLPEGTEAAQGEGRTSGAAETAKPVTKPHVGEVGAHREVLGPAEKPAAKTVKGTEPRAPTTGKAAHKPTAAPEKAAGEPAKAEPRQATAEERPPAETPAKRAGHDLEDAGKALREDFAATRNAVRLLAEIENGRTKPPKGTTKADFIAQIHDDIGRAQDAMRKTAKSVAAEFGEQKARELTSEARRDVLAQERSPREVQKKPEDPILEKAINTLASKFRQIAQAREKLKTEPNKAGLSKQIEVARAFIKDAARQLQKRAGKKTADRILAEANQRARRPAGMERVIIGEPSVAKEGKGTISAAMPMPTAPGIRSDSDITGGDYANANYEPFVYPHPEFTISRPSALTTQLADAAGMVRFMEPGPYKIFPSVQLGDQMFDFTVYRHNTPVGSVRLSLTRNDLLIHRLDMRARPQGEPLTSEQMKELPGFTDAVSKQLRRYFPQASRVLSAPSGRPRSVSAPFLSDLAPAHLTPAAETKRSEIERYLTAMVHLQTGRRIAVRFKDRIDSKSIGWGSAAKSTAAGQYTPIEQIIRYALDGLTPRFIMEIGFHEPFHVVQDILATDQEMAVLARETPRLREIVRRHEEWGQYVDGMSPHEIQTVAYQMYARDRADGGTGAGLHIAIRRLFERIMKFLREVANYLRGLGFNTSEDIFAKTYQGEMAKRPSGPGRLDRMLRDEYIRIETEKLNREFVENVNRLREESLSAAMPRTSGLPAEVGKPVSSHTNPELLKAHPDYKSAKAGDTAAALRFVRDMIDPKTIAEAEKFGTDALYLPVVSVEVTGHNKIPRALAEVYAKETGATAVNGIEQVTRAYHTGANAMERLLSRPVFDGPVQARGRYVIVDDITVMGATLAELAGYIRSKGGDVVGTVTLVNAARDGVLTPRPGQIREIERRFGDAVKELFDIEPAALTGLEATYLLNFRNADALRARAASAGRQRVERLASKGIGRDAVAGGVGGPPPPQGPLSAAMPRPHPRRPIRATPSPTIRDRIADLFASDFGQKVVENLSNLSHRVKILQNEVEARFAGVTPARPITSEPMNSGLPAEHQFYARKRLFPGRVGYVVGGFNKKYLDPLVRFMREKRISLKDASDYFYALHAEERNVALSHLYPVGHDFRDATTDPTKVGASGMSAEEARAILDRIQNGPDAAAYAELRNKVRAINDFNLRIIQHYDLETPQTVAAWRAMYSDYVPLKGWEDAPDEAPRSYKMGSKFNVRGPEVRAALGRGSKAENPLVNMLDQSYRVIERGERNRYLQSLWSALEALPPDMLKPIARLNKGRVTRKINPNTGMVVDTPDFADRYRDEAVHLKIGGEPRFIVFHDAAIAMGVKQMNPNSLGPLSFLLTWMNKMKALWTHYSPPFLLRHFIGRYPIEGFLNSQELRETGDFSSMRYVKEASPFWGTALRAIMARQAGRPAGTLGTHWDEMVKTGGAMTFRSMRDTNLIREHLNIQLRDLTGKPHLTFAQKWRHTIEAIDYITNALDNSLRLAVYSQARDQGMNPQKAAVRARDATIDYQLRAKLSSVFGVFLPFYNTAMRTGTRLTGALARSKTIRRVFLGVVGASIALALWNYLAGGDDTDGTPFFEKIGPWERELNIIIMNPWDRDSKGRPQPIKIPLPYNWALPFNIGNIIVGSFLGKEGFVKHAESLIKSALMAFTPVGETGNILDLVTPEVVRAPAHIIENKNWRGNRLHEDVRSQTGPNAYSGWRPVMGQERTGAGWKRMAEGVNDWTGGNRHKSGLLDFHPESYREIFDQFFGAQKRFGLQIGATASNVYEGKPVTPTDIPLVSVFRGTNYDAANRAAAAHRNFISEHPWLR